MENMFFEGMIYMSLGSIAYALVILMAIMIYTEWKDWKGI